MSAANLQHSYTAVVDNEMPERDAAGKLGRDTMENCSQRVHQPDRLCTSAYVQQELHSTQFQPGVVPLSLPCRSLTGDTAAATKPHLSGYSSAAQATQVRAEPSVTQTCTASHVHGHSMDGHGGETDCQPAATHASTVATASGPVMPHPHCQADPASSLRGLWMPQPVAVAGAGVDGEELMQSRRCLPDPTSHCSEKSPPTSLGSVYSAPSGTNTLPESFVPGQLPASPDAQLPSVNVLAKKSCDAHGSAAVDDASAIEAEQLSPFDEASSPQKCSRMPAAANLEGMPCEEPLRSGQGFTDFAPAPGSNVQHDRACPIEAQAGTWHVAVPTYESARCIAATTGASLAASTEAVMSLLGGPLTSSAHLPPVTEDQSSLFDGACLTTEEGSNRVWASAAVQAGVQSTPSAATSSQGVAEGGFGSSINLPNMHNHHIASGQGHRCWGADTAHAVISGPNQGRVSRWERAADGGQRLACARPQAVPHGDTHQEAEGCPAQSEYKPAVYSTLDTHEPSVPPASLSVWPANYSCGVPGETPVNTASGSFFDEVGLAQGPAHADSAAGATGTQQGQNPGSDSGRCQRDDFAPELTAEPPGCPAIGNTCAVQAQGSESQPYWWEEWGCWLSACGQFYYDEATGTWPSVYPGEPASFEGCRDKEWGSPRACDVDQSDSRSGLPTDAADHVTSDKSSQAGEQADVYRDQAGPSFFDTIMQDGLSFGAVRTSDSQPQGQGQRTCTPSHALVPHAATSGVPDMHGNGRRAGSGAAGVGSGVPAEPAVWPAAPAHPLAESHDTCCTEPGGIAAAGSYCAGGRFFDSERPSFFKEAGSSFGCRSPQQAQCGTGPLGGSQDGAGWCQLPPPQSADVAAPGSGSPCPAKWAGHSHGVLGTHSPTALPQKVGPT